MEQHSCIQYVHTHQDMDANTCTYQTHAPVMWPTKGYIRSNWFPLLMCGQKCWVLEWKSMGCGGFGMSITDKNKKYRIKLINK